MPEFIEVAKEDEIPAEGAAVVEVNGVEIAVINTGGKYYAIHNECTHAGAPLGEGEVIDERQLECPLHGSIFDVTTGEPLEGPADEPVATYEVIVEDGAVKVSLD